MSTCIVRQSIISVSGETYGYELLYNNNVMMGSDSEADGTVASTIESLLLQLNTEKFLDNKKVFITFTPTLMLKNIPKVFEHSKLVIQVDDTVVMHPLAIKPLEAFRNKGYRVAIIDFEFSARYFAFLEKVDMLKLDFERKSESELTNIVNVAKSFFKEVVAFNVNSKEKYDLANKLGVNYLQGTYVATAKSENVKSIQHMQSNFFQLMVAVTRDEPDVDEICEIISRDITLTYSLLRIVNSAYFALRNTVKSVRQALIIMGLGQLKQWIYLLSFKNNQDSIDSELIKTSFLRAQFAAGLTTIIPNLPISKSEAYLMGMFSMLDILMEEPLDVTLQYLNVSEYVRGALMNNEGVCGLLYQLVLSYENADWKKISVLATQLNVSTSLINQQYFECVEYVTEIWNGIMEARFEE